MTAVATPSLLVRMLTFLAREWWTHRAFVAVLLGITLLAGTTLTLTYGPAAGVDHGRYRTMLATLLAVCVTGGVAILVQRTVSAEFDSHHGDQWIRRLRGGLLPVMLAKATFVLLVVAVSLGVAAALYSACLASSGAWLPGHVTFDAARAVDMAIVGLATLPWVWAIATWLPGGRMTWAAVVVVVLFGWLVEGALLPRLAPGLPDTLEWWPWLAATVVLGPIVAAASWLARRNRGHRGSARRGLLAAGLALLPMGGWLGVKIVDYHSHRDPREIRSLLGVDPSGRYALVSLDRPVHWGQEMLRVDLERGEFERMPIGHFGPWASGPVRMADRMRFWWLWDQGTRRPQLLDLTSGEIGPAPARRHPRRSLPGEIREAAALEALARSPFRRANGLKVWPTWEAVLFEEEDGSVTREPALPSGRYVTLVGHGWKLHGGGGAPRFYDFGTRSLLPMPKGKVALAAVLGGHFLYGESLAIGGTTRHEAWHRRPDGSTVTLASTVPESILRKVGPDPRVSLGTVVGSRVLVGVSDRVYALDPVLGDWQLTELPSWTYISGWDRTLGAADWGAPVHRAEDGTVRRFEGLRVRELIPLRDGTAVALDQNDLRIVRLHPDGRVERLYPR